MLVKLVDVLDKNGDKKAVGETVNYEKLIGEEYKAIIKKEVNTSHLSLSNDKTWVATSSIESVKQDDDQMVVKTSNTIYVLNKLKKGGD